MSTEKKVPLQRLVVEALQEEYNLMSPKMNSKNSQFKKWYFILTIIWITFWVLDILVLVPLYPESGIVVNLTNLVSEPDDFSFVWTLVTSPVQLYLIGLFLAWIFRFARRE